MKRWTTIISLVYLLVLPCLVMAQNSDDNSADPVPLMELYDQWKQLNSELIRLEKEFRSELDEENKADLKGRYSALVDESKELVLKIREAASKEIDADKLDGQLSKLLVGLIMNDVEFERPNEAIRLGDKLVAAGVNIELLKKAAKSDRLSIFSKELMEELFQRANQKASNLPHIKITTSKGELVVELFEEEAPNTVANFISLVEKEFYDGLKFHRVIEGFVAQGGDPNGDGSGGPGYSIKCECNSPEARRHFYGSLSMAHAGQDTGGSQFFICLNRTSHLDGRHTVFGRVIKGIEVLDELARTSTTSKNLDGVEPDTITKMVVVRKREHDYTPVTSVDPAKADEPPPSQPVTSKIGKSDLTDAEKSKDVSGMPSEKSDSDQDEE